MAKIVFKELTSNQNVLFPVSLSEKIASNHPVRVVNSVVDALDISSLLRAYKGGGTSSYHPRMMLKVLFYAYLNNIYSCRKIEKALQENIHFMWLSGNSTPPLYIKRTTLYSISALHKDNIRFRRVPYSTIQYMEIYTKYLLNFTKYHITCQHMREDFL